MRIEFYAEVSHNVHLSETSSSNDIGIPHDTTKSNHVIKRKASSQHE